MIEAGAVFRCLDMPRSLSVNPNYIQEVNLVWKRKSKGREQDLANQLGRALHLVIVNLFLKGEPVNYANLIEICQILGLDWREIAALDVSQSEVTSSPKKVTSDELLIPSKPSEVNSEVDKALNDLVGTLCEMLRRLTRKAGTWLGADRTSIFLLDRERNELGSLIADDGAGGCLLIELPANRGIVGLAATSLDVINIPFDVYDDPRSQEAQNTDKRTGYRTYTVLAWPLLNQEKDLVAVVQLINKLKPNYNPQDDLSKRIDPKGFTQEDEARFATFAPTILRILEQCQFCYQLSLNLKKNSRLPQGSALVPNATLIARLKRRERQLRKNLDKI
jgi:hypothetical protein